MAEVRETTVTPSELVRRLSGIPDPLLAVLEQSDGPRAIEPHNVTPEIIAQRKIAAERYQHKLHADGTTVVKRNIPSIGLLDIKDDYCPHCSERIGFSRIELIRVARPEDFDVLVDNNSGIPYVTAKAPHLRLEIPGILLHTVEKHGVSKVSVGGQTTHLREPVIDKFFKIDVGKLRKTKVFEAFKKRPDRPRLLQRQLR